MSQEYINLSDEQIEMTSREIAKLVAEKKCNNFMILVAEGKTSIKGVDPKTIDGRKYIGFSKAELEFVTSDKEFIETTVYDLVGALLKWIKIRIEPKEIFIKVENEYFMIRVSSYVMSGGNIIKDNLYNREKTYHHLPVKNGSPQGKCADI